jgi:hypothetical protein
MVGTVTTMRRRLIALAAAYAIALQAVLASFAALAAAGSTGLPGLCTSSAPQEQPARHTGHMALCIACPACCSEGRLSGMPPAGVELPAPRTEADRGTLRPAKFDVPVTPRNRPPSRAPPAG